MLFHYLLVYSFSKNSVISGKCSVFHVSSKTLFFFKEASEFIRRWASMALRCQEKGGLKHKPTGSCSPLFSLVSAILSLIVWLLGSLQTSAEVHGWPAQLAHWGSCGHLLLTEPGLSLH